MILKFLLVAVCLLGQAAHAGRKTYSFSNKPNPHPVKTALAPATEAGDLSELETLRAKELDTYGIINSMNPLSPDFGRRTPIRSTIDQPILKKISQLQSDPFLRDRRWKSVGLAEVALFIFCLFIRHGWAAKADGIFTRIARKGFVWIGFAVTGALALPWLILGSQYFDFIHRLY